MNLHGIFDVVSKGMGVIKTLVAVGQEAGPAIVAVKNLVEKAKHNTVTATDIAATHKTLDELITDFNEPMKDD